MSRVRATLGCSFKGGQGHEKIRGGGIERKDGQNCNGTHCALPEPRSVSSNIVPNYRAALGIMFLWLNFFYTVRSFLPPPHPEALWCDKLNRVTIGQKKKIYWFKEILATQRGNRKPRKTTGSDKVKNQGVTIVGGDNVEQNRSG